MRSGEILRKYGAATTILFELIDRGALDFESTPVAHAAGDTQISKDEGAFANTTNAFAHEGNGIYSLALTTTEMEAARVVVTIIDQGAKEWEDQVRFISTYGDASGQHAFDLDTAMTKDTIADQVWDEAVSGHSTAGTTGKYLYDILLYAQSTNVLVVDGGTIDQLIDDIKAVTDNLPDSGALNDLAAILADTGTDGVVIVDEGITAAKIAANAIGASELAADAATEIADALLTRDWTSVSGEAARSALNALRFLRNKWSISAGTLTVTEEDDSTTAWTATITDDAGADNVVSVDPA